MHYFCKIFSVTENLYKVAAHFHGEGETKDSTYSAAIVLLGTHLFLLGIPSLYIVCNIVKTPMHSGSSAFCFDVFLSTVNHPTVI
jgi:hypothetical protein